MSCTQAKACGYHQNGITTQSPWGEGNSCNHFNAPDNKSYVVCHSGLDQARPVLDTGGIQYFCSSWFPAFAGASLPLRKQGRE